VEAVDSKERCYSRRGRDNGRVYSERPPRTINGSVFTNLEASLEKGTTTCYKTTDRMEQLHHGHTVLAVVEVEAKALDAEDTSPALDTEDTSPTKERFNS